MKHANSLIRRLNKMRKSGCYIMDKGYDSEKIHSIEIFDNLHALEHGWL